MRASGDLEVYLVQLASPAAGVPKAVCHIRIHLGKVLV